MTVQDLPVRRPGYELPNGGGHVEARQPLLYCSACCGEYSANPSDYWQLPADHWLTCCGLSLTLVEKRTTFYPVGR